MTKACVKNNEIFIDEDEILYFIDSQCLNNREIKENEDIFDYLVRKNKISKKFSEFCRVISRLDSIAYHGYGTEDEWIELSEKREMFINDIEIQKEYENLRKELKK